MQGFYEFIQKRDQNLLRDYINYCQENGIEIDEGLMDTARGTFGKIKNVIAPLTAAALLASPAAGQDFPRRGGYPLPPKQEAPKTAERAQEKQKQDQSAAGQRGDKFDKGGFFEKEQHAEKAKEGFKNVNKVNVFTDEQLQHAVMNPGYNVKFYYKNTMGRPTRNYKDGAFHVNPYGVNTQFNPQKIMEIQKNNKSWKYIPALNMFVDMNQTNPNGDPLLLNLYSASTGKNKGTVANFFGLSVNSDGSITPITSQPMPPGSK